MFGTTYLVKRNDNLYALKTQHILPSHTKKSYNYELWRELDLYDFINKLNKDDQKFFTKLHEYKIYKNCKHIQKRPFKVFDDVGFAKFSAKLDKSKWCVDFLLDYHGPSTFGNYIAKNRLTERETYSFMLQIINIIIILYKAGYSHNDLHNNNIMIKKTTEKYFLFNNKKIPYYGHQLSAIDYGSVLHKKFNNRDKDIELFFKNRERWLYREIMWDTSGLITNFDKYMHNCRKQNRNMPWEKKNFFPFDNTIRSIINNHKDFWVNSIDEYTSDNNIKKLLYKIENSPNKKIHEIVKNKYNVLIIIDLIKNKFITLHPRLHAQYFGWCSYHKINIKRIDYLNILRIKDIDLLIKYILDKMN